MGSSAPGAAPPPPPFIRTHHSAADTTRRYVSSQLETAAHSKLGPLQLPTDRKSEQQRRPQQSPENPQSKPRSSSANNGRVTPNQESGERAHKQPRTGREGAGGSDKDKLQAIYSAAPRPKHQSVWTKENLLRGSSSRKAQEPESVKDMRASVSHDIRQVFPSSFCSPSLFTPPPLPPFSLRHSPPCSPQRRQSSFAAAACPRRWIPVCPRIRTCARAWTRSCRPPLMRTRLQTSSVVSAAQAFRLQSSRRSIMSASSSSSSSSSNFVKVPMIKPHDLILPDPTTTPVQKQTMPLFASASRSSATALRLQVPQPPT